MKKTKNYALLANASSAAALPDASPPLLPKHELVPESSA